MNPVLSICIPTYNRASCLKECLDSILYSMKGYESQIEIVISDNASTDNTRDIVHEFQTQHPWIRYHRNKENIGGNPNIYAVAKLGQGEYIWIIGDDDKIEPDAIRQVLKKLQSGFDLIVCNNSVWDISFSTKKKSDVLHLRKDYSFNDPNEILRRFGPRLGYISAIIIKRACFFHLPHAEYNKYIDYGFPHMYAVYSGVMNEHSKIACVSKPIVCHRSGNSGGYDWYKYFVIGTSLIFEALLDKGYSKQAVRLAKRKTLIEFVIPEMIRKKLRNEYNQIEMFNLISQFYGKDVLFWASYIPVWLVPPLLMRGVKNVIRYNR